MKLHHSDDETGVTLSDRDRDVLRAGLETVDSLVDLAAVAGVFEASNGECEWCDATDERLRPYQLTVDGEFRVLDICADCQTGFVEDAAAEARGDDVAVLGEDADGALDPEDLPPAGGSDTLEGEDG